MDDEPARVSRRRYLAIAAVGLAGCSQQSDGDGSDGDGGGTATATPTPTVANPTPRTPEPSEYDLSTTHDAESWPRYDPDWEPPTTSPLASEYATETLVQHLEIPWDLAFAPDGTLFVTERTGHLKRFSSGSIEEVTRPADAIDAEALEPGSDESSWWLKGGAGGMHGVAVHPEYPEPPLVYCYYTYEADDGTDFNKVVAFDVSREDPWRYRTTVLDPIPAHQFHNAGRIAFGPANYLWVTTGDAGTKRNAQSTRSLAGKVLRMNPDGSPAPDNPDLGTDADPRIYTLGHRNPQGITWLPDGTPVASEHGPNAKDEINVLRAGGNYGWPEARTEAEYEGTEFRRPLVNTGNRTWAPTGCVFYTGDAVPGLSNRLLVGNLRGEKIEAVTITPAGGQLPPAEDGRRFEGWYDDAYVATAHRLFDGELGRVRHVEQGPDGDLWAITSNRDGRASEGFPTEMDDRLLRISVG